jgi:putative ABC transport system permease protein
VGAAWYRARGELRRRWRATVLFVLLVGLAGGVLLTAVAGARRSSTAYERLREETREADLDILFDGPPSDIDEVSVEELADLPQIEAMTSTAFPFIVPAGSGLYPYLDFLAIVGLDEAFGASINRSRLQEGRAPDPDRPDEMAVAEVFARELDLQVGDRVEFESYAPEQLEPLFTTGDAGPPAGPRVTLRVTGIAEAPIFLSESVGSFVPRVLLSPAFWDARGGEMASYPGGFTLRLRNGADDVPAVSAAVRDIFADQPSLELQPASEVDAKIESSIDVTVGALVLSGLVAGLVGCIALAQALGRHLAQDASSGQWLAALGMTRRERVASLFGSVVPVIVGGAVLAVVVAIAASPSMPVGVARRAEPDPGVSIDAWVLGLGFLGIVVVVGAVAVAAALLVDRSTAAAIDADIAGRPSWSARALGRTNLPPAAGIGVGMALEPRAGSAWSVRSALAGVALGVTGLVAVIVFAASLSTLVDSPDFYGAPWEGYISGFGGEVVQELRDTLVDDPDVEQVGIVRTSVALVGGDEMNVHAVEALKGGTAFTLLDGRSPTGAGEAALGTSTTRELDVGIGDTVTIEGTKGTVQATVVGTAAFPVVDERSSVGRGVLLDDSDLAAVVTEESVNHDLVIGWRPGVDAAVANRELSAQAGVDVSSPRLPADVNNLREVDAIPRALAAFLGCLAVFVLVHALVSTTRVRRHELAVLRTLGFQGRQLAATLAWQATTIAAIGLVVGTAIGLVVGRLVWRSVATGIGVVDDPSVPGPVVAAIAVAALLVANVAAALPARAARHVQPATVLRAG